MTFRYSRDWYEKQYHTGPDSDYKLDVRSYDEVNEDWIKRGYRDRLYRVLDEVDLVVRLKGLALEVACHHGKTAFWMLERYSGLRFEMFDFSTPAVAWCRRYNPFPERCVVFQGDVSHIKADDQTYDLVACVDVIEHLPQEVYLDMRDEITRVAKPGGYLLVMCGTTQQVGHINIMSPDQVVAGFSGFGLVRKLSDNYILMRKGGRV